MKYHLILLEIWAHHEFTTWKKEQLFLCYGQKKTKTLSEARKGIWKNHVPQSNTTAPKLKSLPPTDKVYHKNLKGAHIQAAIWRNLLQTYPPVINPLDFGWVKDLTSPWLVPSTVLLGVNLIADEVLEIIRCSCSSQQTYKSQRCTCIKSCLSCSTFCEYQGGFTCCNPSTLKFDSHFDESKSDKQQ